MHRVQDSNVIPIEREAQSTAVGFLQRLYPQGPWVITAIIPDGETETRTFLPSQKSAMADFIRTRNASGRNVYFAINKPKRAVTKKAKKKELAEANFLHVDADPDGDEKPEEFKARFRPIVAAYQKKPTFIIDSGNGIQLLWRLEKPVQLDGEAEIADIEARNVALLKTFKAPAGTHNVDRIFRVPGTTNYPNQKKLTKGRVPCPAVLIEYNADKEYAVTDFSKDDQPNPQPQRSSPKGVAAGSAGGASIPSSLASLLYVTGSGPYPTRSELLFAFLTGVLRRGETSDEAIVAACLDESYAGMGIFEHVRENGGLDYIKTQITKALNELPATDPSRKTIIQVKRGERYRATDQTEFALREARCPVFHRGGALVEPLWRWEKGSDKNRDELTCMLVKLNISRLAYMTGKHAATYRKYDVRLRKWLDIDPPADVLEQLLELRHWGFKTVRGIVNTPTMRPDGSLLIEAGYDPETQIWFKSAADVRLPLIPDEPKKEQAQAALKLLLDLLEGFPFKEELDKSVAIAAMMTPVLRGAYEFAPMFFILAPEAGSGKTYLVNTCGTLATGRPPIAVPTTDKKEELDKRLSAAAFGATPILHLNNLDFDLESSLLSQILTEGIFQIRPFGKNLETIICDCRTTTVFANGNNVHVVGDLVRRTLTVRLDAQTEYPENREFAFDPIERVRQHRGRYIAAVFLITRAYLAAGSPKSEAKPLGGFEDWSRLVREPLIWLGMEDPVRSMEDNRANDPERDSFRKRINELMNAFGVDTEFTASDVFEKCSEMIPSSFGGKPSAKNQGLCDAFVTREGKSASAISIGLQLKKDQGRVIGQRSIRRVGSDKAHGLRYKMQGPIIEPEPF